MKFLRFIIITLLFLVSGNLLAGRYSCKTISGSIDRLIPDPDCKIKQAKFSSNFPDVIFLPPSEFVPFTCFSGQIHGRLDNRNVDATAYSGLVANGIDSTGADVLTAVSAINIPSSTFSDIRGYYGWFFTKDVIFKPSPFDNTKESLVIIDGNKIKKGGLEIIGNGLFEETTFSGKVCIENN
jgi:hypothetical protein